MGVSTCGEFSALLVHVMGPRVHVADPQMLLIIEAHQLHFLQSRISIALRLNCNNVIIVGSL